MICEWGMSEVLGPMTFGEKEEQIFLGKEFNRHIDYSEETARKIDEEIRTIVYGSYEKARQILEERQDGLERIAEALLERETLQASQIQALIDGQELPEIPKPAEPDEDREKTDVKPSPAPADEQVIVGRPQGAPDPEKA
jgi:cell division protease FtsH